MPSLRPAYRKAVLAAHVLTSVGWLGAAMCLFVLTWTSRLNHDVSARASIYDVMLLLTDWVVVPLALLALATGIACALGTPWRLLQHWWVVVKLAVTFALATLSVLRLRPKVSDARHAAHVGQLAREHAATASLTLAATTSLSLYAAMTIVSIYKPWGRTPRGRWTAQQAAALRAVARKV